ncbi:MAG: NfeD family protein [Verrucomicrobiota bacterium]
MVTLVVTLICLGFVLLALEVVLPGGVAGLIGAVVLLIGIVALLVSPEFDFLGTGTRWLIASAVIAVVGLSFIWWMKNFHKMPFIRGEILEAEIAGTGVGPMDDLHALVGRSGVALTDLRPEGKVRVEKVRYDAFVVTGCVERNAMVEVTGVKNGKLRVRPANPSSTSGDPDDLMPS